MRIRITILATIAIMLLASTMTQAATTFNLATMGVWPDNPVALQVVDDDAIAVADQLTDRRLVSDIWACSNCRTLSAQAPGKPAATANSAGPINGSLVAAPGGDGNSLT